MAGATSEVIKAFLIFKIRAFGTSQVNLIVYPSKLALALMRRRCDSSMYRRPAPSSSVESSPTPTDMAGKEAKAA
jgi:hypothetical protein